MGSDFFFLSEKLKIHKKRHYRKKTGFRNLWTVPQATDTKIRGCRGISEPLPVRQTIKITKPICQNLPSAYFFGLTFLLYIKCPL